jgi:hypothetical protein
VEEVKEQLSLFIQEKSRQGLSEAEIQNAHQL